MKKNILLIGFMGVGKGTIARALSKKIQMYTIDTDHLIESMENRSIKQIFKVDSEDYFRNLEKKTALWLESYVKNTVISTGGGFYKQENLKNIGKIIYLKASFDVIENRLNKSFISRNRLNKRPLLKNIDETKKLFDSRIQDYENISDIIIDVENKKIKNIVNEILGKL